MTPNDAGKEPDELTLVTTHFPKDLMAHIRHNFTIDEHGDPPDDIQPETPWEVGYAAGIRSLYLELKDFFAARSIPSFPAKPFVELVREDIYGLRESLLVWESQYYKSEGAIAQIHALCDMALSSITLRLDARHSREMCEKHKQRVEELEAKIAGGWISVEERLPEVGERVIVYLPDWFSIWVAHRGYHNNEIIWKTQGDKALVRPATEDQQPSHWAKLPAAPHRDI